jgi:hypothetical protein
MSWYIADRSGAKRQIDRLAGKIDHGVVGAQVEQDLWASLPNLGRSGARQAPTNADGR